MGEMHRINIRKWRSVTSIMGATEISGRGRRDAASDMAFPQPSVSNATCPRTNVQIQLYGILFLASSFFLGDAAGLLSMLGAGISVAGGYAYWYARMK